MGIGFGRPRKRDFYGQAFEAGGAGGLAIETAQGSGVRRSSILHLVQICLKCEKACRGRRVWIDVPVGQFPSTGQSSGSKISKGHRRCDAGITS